MLTITAIMRVKAGTEQAMHDALLVVADNVLNEPQTIRFFVSQHSVDPWPFTTCECVADQAKMSWHDSARPWRAFMAPPCHCSGLRRPPHAAPSPNLCSDRDPSCGCFAGVFRPRHRDRSKSNEFRHENFPWKSLKNRIWCTA